MNQVKVKKIKHFKKWRREYKLSEKAKIKVKNDVQQMINQVLI